MLTRGVGAVRIARERITKGVLRFVQPLSTTALPRAGSTALPRPSVLIRGLQTKAFKEAKVLAGGQGDVASRVIRLAQENPRIQAVILQLEGTKPPSVPLPKNVELIWVNSDNGSPYTNVDLITKIIGEKGVTEFFPGWGNLSEDAAALAKVKLALDKNDGRLIGPSPEFIARIGNKHKARKFAQENGIPVPPGACGLVTEANFETEIGDSFKDGDHIMWKAPESGGGYGMRKATVGVNIREMFEEACAEGRTDGLVAELLVDDPFKHVEFQSFGINGRTVVMEVERDCSKQYKNAKWDQFSDPKNGLPRVVRQTVSKWAELLGQSTDQNNATTHEFLMIKKEDTLENKAYLKHKYKVTDSQLIIHEGIIYLSLYNESNTRLQVEHPVTEEVYGMDILRVAREIARVDQTKKAEDAQSIFNFLTGRNSVPVYQLPTARQVRVYGASAKWDNGAANITLGSGVGTSPFIVPILPPGGVLEGVVGQPPSSQDPLCLKLTAKGKNIEDVTAKIQSVMDGMITGDVKTNLTFLREMLRNPDEANDTVQTFSRQLCDSEFYNRVLNPTTGQNIFSAIKALALVKVLGLQTLRPGAMRSPDPDLGEMPSVELSAPPLTDHWGRIFSRIQKEQPDLPLIEQRKAAAIEYCKGIRERYHTDSDKVGFICTRRRDTAQAIRQNILPEELLPEYKEYHDRQPYVAIETTMGGNDQAKRGGERKSENEQFKSHRSSTQVDAGLVRGSIQVKLGDKAASREEREAYIREKSGSGGPILVQEFQPFHDPEDWLNEAELWAKNGHALVLYPPEHADEMSPMEKYTQFTRPCFQGAKERGFYDLIAFEAGKDTSSATKVGNAKKEEEVNEQMEKDGFGDMPRGHHTHDTGYGVAVSVDQARAGKRIFWVSPDCEAGSGANPPETALYTILNQLGLNVDFNPELAQEFAPVDGYARRLGRPYMGSNDLTASTIRDAYLAPGALSHTIKAIKIQNPDASPQQLQQIMTQITVVNKFLFKDLLLLPPLTPHPNKLSNTAIMMEKIAKDEGVKLNQLTKDEMLDFVTRNLGQLAEMVKYLSGEHYPKWPQYQKVKESYPDLVDKAVELYQALGITNQDIPWNKKLEAASNTGLEMGMHLDQTAIVDMAYHGPQMHQALADLGLTPESMYMLKEGDLQAVAGGVNKATLVDIGQGEIPLQFFKPKTEDGQATVPVQLYGEGGPMTTVTVKLRQTDSGIADTRVYGKHSTGVFVGKSVRAELERWLVGSGIIFPNEKIGMKNENKNINPIDGPDKMVMFCQKVSSTEQTKRTEVLESGKQYCSFSECEYSPEIQTTLLHLNNLRTAGNDEIRKREWEMLHQMGSDYLDEAIALFPPRKTPEKQQRDLADFLTGKPGYAKIQNILKPLEPTKVK